MATTNEIEFLVETRKGSLSANTITNYKNYYRRLRTLIPTQIKDTSEETIITAIRQAVYTADDTKDETKIGKALPVSVKQSLLNVAIVIRQVYNKPIADLIDFRTASKDDLLEANVERNKSLKETLPTYKVLVDYTEQLLKDEKWEKYIINYLLISFGVRNMDLDLTITRNASIVNNKDNWLILRKNSVRYMRYVFKTADTFECRENEIKSEKFIYAVEEIIGDKTSIPLLRTADGERIKKVNLNKYISRATYDELGQGAYFKISLNKNKADIERLSANRGTSSKNVIEYYDVDFKNEEGKQKALQKANDSVIDNKKMPCKSKIPKGESGVERKQAKKQLKQQEIANAHTIIEAEKAEEQPKPKKRLTIKKKKLVIVE